MIIFGGYMSTLEIKANILKVLAHPIRLQIIEKLRTHDSLCVCKLNEDVNFSQSNLSQHLRILRDSGILTAEKKGSWMHYSIKNRNILSILDALESFN